MASGAARRQQSRAWSEAEARAVLAEFEQSGQSMSAFAAARGLVPQRLGIWRRRLAPVKAAARECELLPVHVRVAQAPTDADNGQASVTVTLGAEVRVQVRTLDGASAAWVAMLAHALTPESR
jgi:hypothetical protein